MSDRYLVVGIEGPAPGEPTYDFIRAADEGRAIMIVQEARRLARIVCAIPLTELCRTAGLLASKSDEELDREWRETVLGLGRPAHEHKLKGVA